MLHYTVIGIKRNFLDLILLGREYYLNISGEETLCLLTNETVFRLLGSNCTSLHFFQDKKACLVIHGYVDRVMEVLARHLNMAIPNYVPISPFNDADSSPVIYDSVQYVNKDHFVCEESKLVKNAIKDSDSSNIESSNARKLLNPRRQVYKRNVEVFRTDVKTTEDKLNNEESARTDLNNSTILNQHGVTNMNSRFGDSNIVQLNDGSTDLRDEHCDAQKVTTSVKPEYLESTVREQCPTVPLKKTKLDDHTKF